MVRNSLRLSERVLHIKFIRRKVRTVKLVLTYSRNIFTELTRFSMRKHYLLTKRTTEMSPTADSRRLSTKLPALTCALIGLLIVTGCAEAIPAVGPPSDTTVAAVAEQLVVTPDAGIEQQEADFHEIVRTPGKIVIVDFWARWCGPCRMLAPELEKVALARKDDVVVLKINVDDNPELAQHFGINSIPDIRFFKDGQPAGGVRGFLTAPELLEELPQ